jgi:RHS repeat-associated protein
MYIDGLVLRDRDTDDDGDFDERLYCLQDANWNAVAIADATGTVVQRLCYDPFGMSYVLAADFTATTDSYIWTTRFTGRELDLESRLYSFRARYVHATLGTFINRDTLGYIDGNSLYVSVPRRASSLGVRDRSSFGHLNSGGGRWPSISEMRRRNGSGVT